MFFFRNDAAVHGRPGVNPQQQDAATENDEERWYVCRQCHQKITRPGFHLNVQGRHAHTYANPSGILFDIRCFSNAQGYGFIGPSSTDFTWFAGYAWRIAICVFCLTHIGWYFTNNAGSAFFGFIADRLTLLSRPAGE